MDIGPKIKFYRQRQGMRQEDLALKAELSRGYITHLETGRREPTIESLDKIAKVLGVTLQDMFSEHTDASSGDNYNLRSIPISGRVSAGRPTEAVEMPDMGSVIISVESDNVIAVIADGTSLNRVIPQGSVVIIDLDDRDPRHGQMYMIQTESDGATLKRFTTSGNVMRFEPYSTDPQHDDTFLNQPVEIVGRIVAMQQHFR